MSLFDALSSSITLPLIGVMTEVSAKMSSWLGTSGSQVGNYYFVFFFVIWVNCPFNCA